MAAAATNLKKGAHVLIEGELRSREYDGEITVGTPTTTITQRVWEIRVDSIIKLDWPAKAEANDQADAQ